MLREPAGCDVKYIIIFLQVLYPNFLINLAGLPATIILGSTFLTTTEPAPIIELYL